MADDNHDKLRQAADSIWGLIAARYVLPIVVSVLLALGGYLLNDIRTSIAKVEDGFKPIWSQLSETNSKLHSIQAGVDITQAKQDEITSQIRTEILDHEARIRVLERLPASRQPPP